MDSVGNGIVSDWFCNRNWRASNGRWMVNVLVPGSVNTLPAYVHSRPRSPCSEVPAGTLQRSVPRRAITTRLFRWSLFEEAKGAPRLWTNRARSGRCPACANRGSPPLPSPRGCRQVVDKKDVQTKLNRTNLQSGRHLYRSERGIHIQQETLGPRVDTPLTRPMAKVAFLLILRGS